MNKYFTYTAAMLLVLAGVLNGCKKDAKVNPTPPAALTAGVIGKYTPSGAAKSIVAMSIPGGRIIQAKLDSSNGFSITNLVAGSYKIGFTAMPGFTTPDTVSVILKEGENFDVGLISFQRDSAKGSISGTISPAKAAATVTATNLYSNRVYQAVADTVTGIFKIAGMDTGTYSVSFTSASTFRAPPAIVTKVNDKQESNIGNVVYEAGAGISGIAGPAGAVSYVNAYSVQTFQSYIIYPDANNGAFKTVLPAGDYIISFYAAPGYRSPGNTIGVTLIPGQSIDIGTVTMVRYFLSAAPLLLYSYRLNYSNNNLTIASTKKDIDNGSFRDFEIIMDSITAPGTYQCKNTNTSSITYSTKNSSFSPTITWSTVGGIGTVVVTSIDTVNKEIKGTFTATLVATGYADVVIDKGSFDFVYQ